MLRVAVLELPARWGEPEAALAEVDRLLAAGPADLAILPELALTGYVSPAAEFDPTRFAEPIDGPTVRAAAAIAERRRVHLVTPLVLAERGAIFNAAVVVAPDGSVVATYRKRHPWFPERWATAGELAPPLFDVAGLTVTIAICYDGHFVADDSANVLAKADLLVFTSAWVDEEDSRLPLLQSIARSSGVSIANANWAPGVVIVPGQGGSCVLDARGETVAALASSYGASSRATGSRDPCGERLDAVVSPRGERAPRER
ncbi:MAG: carbon-nitrogen hydrolase family protein [Labilithrix sp.]|nr:carbon-nitrogen hydrolase family protein [Labilithrix sp.]